MSLERGVCLCSELQDLCCYRGRKEAFPVTRTISTTWRRCCRFFFLQGKAWKEIHAIITDTLGERAPSYAYATVKDWVDQFKRGDFSTCDAPLHGRLNTVTTLEFIYQIHELILEDHRISTKSIDEQLGISREWVGTIISED